MLFSSEEIGMDQVLKVWEQICIFFFDYVATPITHMKWYDILDVLILGAVLYELFRYARHRRAGRVMIGLVLVVFVCFVIYMLGLPTLSYIISMFAAAAFFCVVVIFQPEIRDALERFGNSTIVNPGSDTLPKKKFAFAKNVAEEIVDATFCMSEKKTGALIIFEGLTKLGDHMESGKIVDARVTSHLLQNIFDDKAPLHDGALIIRNMRIWSASCVLPSSRGHLDFGSMGTRHRAAVGVTEVSDALALIVSEETGVVSVAQDGKLLRGVDKETLYDILMTYLAGRLYLRSKRGVHVNPFDRVPKYNRSSSNDGANEETAQNAPGFADTKNGDEGEDQLTLNFDAEKTEQDSEV